MAVSSAIPAALDWDVLNAVALQFFRHHIEWEPNVLVVALFEGIEFTVVSPPVSVDLGVFVIFQCSSHGPLAVDKPAVSNF